MRENKEQKEQFYMASFFLNYSVAFIFHFEILFGHWALNSASMKHTKYTKNIHMINFSKIPINQNLFT